MKRFQFPRKQEALAAASPSYWRQTAARAKRLLKDPKVRAFVMPVKKTP